MEIIPGIFQIKTSIVNLYLIVEDEGLALVDAGTKAAYQPVVDLVQSLGRSISELQHILLTHADIDHIGTAMRLKAESGARIYASQIEAEALAIGQSSRRLKVGVLAPFFTWLERRSGVMKFEVDEIVAEGQKLLILGGLQVIETPGHTPGHLSYYSVERNLLFAGDAVRTVPGRVNYNEKKMTNWDHEVMQQSVHKLAGYKPEIVCGGHGPVVYDAAETFPERH